MLKHREAAWRGSRLATYPSVSSETCNVEFGLLVLLLFSRTPLGQDPQGQQSIIFDRTDPRMVVPNVPTCFFLQFQSKACGPIYDCLVNACGSCCEQMRPSRHPAMVDVSADPLGV